MVSFIKRYPLSEKFIRDYKDKVWWNEIFKYQVLSKDLINDFNNKVNWKDITIFFKNKLNNKNIKDKFNNFLLKKIDRLKKYIKWEEFKDINFR